MLSARERRALVVRVGFLLLFAATAVACIFDSGTGYQGGGRRDTRATAATEEAPPPPPTSTGTAERDSAPLRDGAGDAASDLGPVGDSET